MRIALDAMGGDHGPEVIIPGAARALERRQAIIEAALDEFIARGFTATRLDDVAKRAGVSAMTVLRIVCPSSPDSPRPTGRAYVLVARARCKDEVYPCHRREP